MQRGWAAHLRLAGQTGIRRCRMRSRRVSWPWSPRQIFRIAAETPPRGSPALPPPDDDSPRSSRAVEGQELTPDVPILAVSFSLVADAISLTSGQQEGGCPCLRLRTVHLTRETPTRTADVASVRVRMANRIESMVAKEDGQQPLALETEFLARKKTAYIEHISKKKTRTRIRVFFLRDDVLVCVYLQTVVYRFRRPALPKPVAIHANLATPCNAGVLLI